MMDDSTHDREEFLLAYDELATINRYLGGVRAVRRFLPSEGLVLDAAAGACDIGDRLVGSGLWQVVALDLNTSGLSRAKRSRPVLGDALSLPFGDDTFDCVTASLFFHHLSDEDCVRALQGMVRVSRRWVIVNDLHRAQVAYWSILGMTRLFGSSTMVKNDAPLSVQRGFRLEELVRIARRAGFAGQVHRSFPYRLVLVVDKTAENLE